MALVVEDPFLLDVHEFLGYFVRLPLRLKHDLRQRLPRAVREGRIGPVAVQCQLRNRSQVVTICPDALQTVAMVEQAVVAADGAARSVLGLELPPISPAPSIHARAQQFFNQLYGREASPLLEQARERALRKLRATTELPLDDAILRRIYAAAADVHSANAPAEEARADPFEEGLPSEDDEVETTLPGASARRQQEQHHHDEQGECNGTAHVGDLGARPSG
jgi:hypothetical protein